MARQTELYWLVFVLLVVSNRVQGKGQDVPCYFIFGDSLADNGNNDYINTSIRAHYSPYGIDFPNGATGRFTNGRTVVDLLADLLGFNHYIPPFATAGGGQQVLRGLNYASAGSGIRIDTSSHASATISLMKQVQHHRTAVSRIHRILGNKNKKASSYLGRCLHTVGIGSNDYLNNYFLPKYYNSSRIYTPEQFATDLVDRLLFPQLDILFKYGARKVALFGLGPIGCIPAVIAANGKNNTSCINIVNDAVQLFNSRLKSLVDRFNSQHTNAQFTYINTYGINSEKPPSGFKNIVCPCCPVDTAAGLCLPNTANICKNRAEYYFWDAYHPTEAANLVLAKRVYRASTPSDAYPYDISSLVKRS